MNDAIIGILGVLVFIWGIRHLYAFILGGEIQGFMFWGDIYLFKLLFGKSHKRILNLMWGIILVVAGFIMIYDNLLFPVT